MYQRLATDRIREALIDTRVVLLAAHDWRNDPPIDAAFLPIINALARVVVAERQREMDGATAEIAELRGARGFLAMTFAPGSSLGGERPKASVIDQHGRLSIAKFPKETDDYSIELWEEVALRLGVTGPDAHRTHADRRTRS
uniref:Uncharacterized protein n=1 Tax=Caulobacter sp. (strain K31) TaxID=366602 RepID=B0SYI1_CAUSK